jgi:hypothetical protein
MRVMAEGINPGAAVEIELGALLAPEVESLQPARVAIDLADAIGSLAALLVTKGVCTIEEAQKATNTMKYKVVGSPVKQRGL